jgi:WD40 repeat protein/serine/threonine protein kinase
MNNPAPGCPSAQELEQLLDEVLDDPQRQAVTAHIGACPDCQATLENLTADTSVSNAALSGVLSLTVRKSAALADTPGLAFLERVKRAAPLAGEAAARGPHFPALPGYEILQELGRGGMGVVYKARQKSLNRLVAVKMMLAGAHAGGKDLARFRQEAEAVARLRHPNIVQIYDIGESDGRPYLALEYAAEGSLARWLHGDPQPVKPAVALVETLARAVHFAHQHHVVHRDLKPANVLLSRKSPAAAVTHNPDPSYEALGSDSRPVLSEFEPKVSDFGLAKRLDEHSSKTASGEVVGTPSYMAPEQAAGKARLIGPATDVYALGAVLYELLTGRPPFKGATPVDTLVQVLHEEPLRPARLRPDLPRDLETVCLKCLHKDPARRYHSAQAMADDLHRFLHGKPVLARPVGPLERAWKWARHRPLSASLLAAVILSTVLGLAGVSWQWRRAALALSDAEEARGVAAQDREKVKAALYYSLIAQAQLQWRVNDPVSRCVPAAAQADQRGWEWYYLQGLFHADLFSLAHNQSGPGGGVVYQPGGRWLASVVGGHLTGAEDRTAEVRLWDATTGALRQAHACPAGVHRLAVRPDGRRLALAAADGTVLVLAAPSGTELLRRRPHTDSVMGLAYSPDGKLLASASWDQTVKVWTADTGEVRHVLRGHGERVQSVAFHPAGTSLASGAWDGKVRVWDAGSGALLRTLEGHRSAIYCVAYSPDGRLLASAGNNGNIKVWDVAAGLVVQSLTGHAGSVLSLAFSPDGRYIAYGGSDATVRVWDVEDGVERITFRGHTGEVEGVCFSPDGQRLASVSPGQGVVKVWDLTRHPEHGTFARTGPGADVEALAFRDGSKTLVSLTNGGKLQTWDTATGVLQDERLLAVSGSLVTPAVLASFDPKAKRVAARDRADIRRVKAWDVATGTELATCQGHTLPVCCIRFSGDGRRLMTYACTTDRPAGPGELRVWDAQTGVPELWLAERGQVFAVAFSPDGRWLALGGEGGRLTLVRCADRPRVLAVAAHRGNVTALAFDPKSLLLVSAGQGEGAVKVWDVDRLTSSGGQDAEPVQSLAAPNNLYDLAFSPDGKRLAGITRDLVKLWDIEAGQEVLTLRGAPQRHWDPPFNPRVAFSPDGTRLAGTNWDESISLWVAEDRTTEGPAEPSRVARRRAIDRRAQFWHLQEAEHCLKHGNVAAAVFHFNRLRDVPLRGPLQARKDVLAARLQGPAGPR